MAHTSASARGSRTRVPARIAVVVAASLGAALVAALLPGTTPGRDLVPTSIAVSVLSGDVLVGASADAAARRAREGETVTAGMTVRTEAPGGRAVLTFRDGSTVGLEPGAAVSIDEHSIGPRGEMIVRLGQSRGKTWSFVQPLLSPSSRFIITTPTASAVARGTSFEVDVTIADAVVATEVSVFHGQVDVVAAGMVRPVVASETTRVAHGTAPEPVRRIDGVQGCLRLVVGSSALMIVTDPDGRAAGQGRLSTVSQIPRSTVTPPQAETQRVDVFAPGAGTWEIGIVPRGEGGPFHLEVTSAPGTQAVASKILTGTIQAGQQLVTRIVLRHDGALEGFEVIQPTSQLRAKIADVGATPTAYLPGARPFAPAPTGPLSCGR